MESVKSRAVKIMAGRRIEIVKGCMKSKLRKGDITKIAHVTGKTRCKKTGQDASYYFQFEGCDLEHYVNLKTGNCHDRDCLVFRLNQGYDWVKVRIL